MKTPPVKGVIWHHHKLGIYRHYSILYQIIDSWYNLGIHQWEIKGFGTQWPAACQTPVDRSFDTTSTKIYCRCFFNLPNWSWWSISGWLFQLYTRIHTHTHYIYIYIDIYRYWIYTTDILWFIYIYIYIIIHEWMNIHILCIYIYCTLYNSTYLGIVYFLFSFFASVLPVRLFLGIWYVPSDCPWMGYNQTLWLSQSE